MHETKEWGLFKLPSLSNSDCDVTLKTGQFELGRLYCTLTVYILQCFPRISMAMYNKLHSRWVYFMIHLFNNIHFNVSLLNYILFVSKSVHNILVFKSTRILGRMFHQKNKWISHSINRSINQLVDQSIIKSINQSTNQSINQKSYIGRSLLFSSIFNVITSICTSGTNK